MKIQITQPNLNRALGLLSRVAGSRTPLPILSNILIKATDGVLEMSATNLEVAIVCKTTGTVDETGSVAVPARLLHDFVSQLPKDLTVNLVFEGTKLYISAGSYSSHIQGSQADDFPAIPVVKGDVVLEVENEQLKNALDTTMLAASHDETRPILGGIYLHSEGGKIFMAATDGYRLAEREFLDMDTTISVVVPSSTLQDVLRIMQDSDEKKMTLQFDEGQFGVKTEQVQLVSRLVDGQYPAYRQLIPDQSDINFTIAKEEFLTAAKLAGLFARESGGSITIKASEEEKTVTISSIASQIGDNSSSISGEISGTGEVVVNVKYLADALGCFSTDQISFRFSGAISPCVITAKEQPGYQHIVMPLKS